MKIRIVKEQNLGSEFPGKEAGKGYTMSREIIDMLRSKVYPKLNDDELEEFGTEMHDHFMAYMKESSNENLTYKQPEGLDKVTGGIPYRIENGKAIISMPLPDDVKERIIKRAKANGYSASPNMAGGVTIRKEDLNENKSGLDRIKFHFDKLFGPDLRFDINRDPNNPERDRIDVRGSQQDLANFGNDLQGEKMEGYEVFWTDDDDRGQIVRIVKSDSINEKKDKADRCLRIARRKIPQSSAYRSGLIVKCRKGMIWKKEK